LTDIATELAAIVGDDHITSGSIVAERMTSYWNNTPMQARVMVFPQTTDEVSAILRCCNAHGQSVITQGGLTNCVAAAEPTEDDVVLSLDKMNKILEIDPVGATAVVEAGVVLQTVQESVAEQGLRFPLDLGSRGAWQLYDWRQYCDECWWHECVALRHDAQSRPRP